MSVEEAAELARRSIYHATFRDGASGGVASGMLSSPLAYLHDHTYTYLCATLHCLFPSDFFVKCART